MEGPARSWPKASDGQARCSTVKPDTEERFEVSPCDVDLDAFNGL